MASKAITKANTDVTVRTEAGRAMAMQRGSLSKDDFYSIGEKQIPSARGLQKMANAQMISSEVLRIEWYDRENFYKAACTAYVRAWIGPKAKPRQETTQAVTLSMVGIIQRYATKKLAGKADEWRGKGAEPGWFKKKQADGWAEGDVLIGDDGRIMPTGKKHQVDMLSYLADQFMFLDRSAITKAESRAFDKLLRPDAIRDGAADEYNDDHGNPLAAATVDPDTGEIFGESAADASVDGSAAVDPPPPPGRAAADQADAPSAPAPAEQSVSFPPSEQEMQEHKAGVEKMFTKDPAPVTLSQQAAALIDAIDKIGGFRQQLQDMGSDLTKAKEKLKPDEYARVMQHFWGKFNAAK